MASDNLKNLYELTKDPQPRFTHVQDPEINRVARHHLKDLLEARRGHKPRHWG